MAGPPSAQPLIEPIRPSALFLVPSWIQMGLRRLDLNHREKFPV